MKSTQMCRGVALVLAPMVLAGWIQACGGSKSEAKGPGSIPTGAGSGPSGTPVVTNQGVQVGISDAPSSSDVPVAERPKMNESARGPYMQALEAFGRGALAESKQLFLQSISADPKAYQAHYSLGVILERLADADALARYRQAFTIVPDYEPAITAYGLLLARRGSTTEADQFLTERHAQMPKSAAVAAALAEVKSIQRDTGSAQQLAQAALKLNPNFAPAMVTLARDHFRNRRLDLAKYALQAILDGFGADNPPRDTDNAEARLLRALILKEEGLRASAIKELEVVLAKRPDMVDAGVQLATYYLESGNGDKAEPLLQKALAYNKDNLVAHLNLADCYRLLGRPADAKREFDWVLAKDSSLVHVHYNLGLLYLFSDSFPGKTPVQQVDAAIAALEKYKELRGRSAAPAGSDAEQLITRAKAKKAMLEAEAKAGKPAAAPSSSGSAAPAPKTSG
jgi:Tfp pilus assembly protein PilF